MVAETVEVLSRKAGEAEGWRWASDGHGEFTVSEAEDAPARGTRITLELKKGQEEFLDPLRLERIVRTYSDHIAVPVVLVKDGAEETLNAASALWTRPKSEISEAQYKEFYHHVAHAFDEPWLRLHFKVEGKIVGRTTGPVSEDPRESGPIAGWAKLNASPLMLGDAVFEAA